MPVLPFPEWRPDLSDYRGQYSKTILNVLPRADGYGPFQSLVAAFEALPAQCRGGFVARKSDGSIVVFAGTVNRLYTLDNTDLDWTDASKDGSAYSDLSNGHQWQFRQFNNFVFAVQQNVTPQVFDLTSSTEFDVLGGSPPNAAYIAIVNRFVVLSGLQSPNATRIQWSGLNATTTWTSGVSQSDFQDLPDGGRVFGVAGGELGVIFQESSIRRLTYAPGSPYVFGIDRISADDGLLAPYALIEAGDRIFFPSPQGFKMLVPGSYPQPIGKEKVDRTFLEDYDTDHPEYFIGAHDPRTQVVFWAYKSVNSAANAFDTILCYDWALDKWTKIQTSGQYIMPLARPGLTLENIDTVYGADLDALTEPSSFDDISLGSRVQLAAVDTDARVGFFTGPNLEATLVTSEQADDNQRFRVKGARPVTDAVDANVSLVLRETIQGGETVTQETTTNVIGICEQNISGRYVRGKLRIPEGEEWTYASGIEPQVISVGRR